MLSPHPVGNTWGKSHVLHHPPVLREDIDSRRVVRTVRQVQGAELGHQVHKAASHTLLVLREPKNINTPLLSFFICTLQLQHAHLSAQEPPAVWGGCWSLHSRSTHTSHFKEEEEEGTQVGLRFCGTIEHQSSRHRVTQQMRCCSPLQLAPRGKHHL